jgi:hypothetical protein
MANKSVFVRVVAKPINFPETVEVLLHCLDDQEKPTGKGYKVLPASWEEVAQRYMVPVYYREEAEGYLRTGQAANLGNRWVRGDFIETDG